MSFETEKQDNDNLDMYSGLSREKAKIVVATTSWMTRATALHIGVDAAKQAEIVALRDALKTELQTALGL